MLSKLDIAIKENIEKEHTVETFKKQVLINNDGCHIWQGQKNINKGYGAFTVYSKEFAKKFTIKAHRFAYALEHGFDALPQGTMGGKERMVINHLCHNRACVNPIHLEVITNNENVSPAKRKPKVLNG